MIAAVDGIIAPLAENPAPLEALRKVGAPYVNAYLDAESRRQSLRSFPIFMLFVIVMNVVLYRSWRTLLAFLLAIGASVATTVGYIGVTGGVFTMVSGLVPMTILITCTATLVYIHSRFVEHPRGTSVDEHQVFALCNKFLACTASVFATAVGFAALAVSKIRPVREMGIWVAVGLVFTFFSVFTLFPALQKILRTPTAQDQKPTGEWFQRLTGWLPGFSYRYRFVLVIGSLLLCAAGAVAAFGFPGLIDPMPLQVNALEYVNHDHPIYKDTKRIEAHAGGLSLTEVWLRSTQYGAMTEPDVIRGIDHFQQALEGDEMASSVVGPITVLRMMRYVGEGQDRLPEDDEALEKMTSNMEGLLKTERNLQHFIEPKEMRQTHVAVVTRTLDYPGCMELAQRIRGHWATAQARDPALKALTIETTGLGALQAKISHYLVPTLVESFGLTVVIIFGTFLVVFRNGAARVMAMIPSLFAILVMFLIMRLTGMALNAATILIASTVLGTSENDQIHFFYHYQEKGKEVSAEERLRHTFRIAGRAIFFATLINAVGFLGFASATLPPIREFGLLSALAFVLSMIADFTALPAALWLVFREKPDARKAKPGADSTL